MSKQKKESDDEFDDDDFLDKDEEGPPRPQRNGRSGDPFGGVGDDFAPDFSAGMGGMGGGGFGFGGGLGGGFGGGLGGFGGGFDGGFGRMGGMGMGMGGMGGMGGFGGFGGHSHGMNGMNGHIPTTNGDSTHPPETNGHSNQPEDNLFSFAKGSSKKEQDKQKAEEEQRRKLKEKEELQQEKLQAMAKKQDIPEEQQITLVDWAIRGQLQVVRLVLEHILIPYRQKKYVFLTKDQWQKEDMPKLKQKYPAIELPYLQDGEKIICGIQAMIVHILHKYNRLDLLGNTPEQRVRVATAKTIYWQAVQDYLQLCYGEYEQDISWQRAREKYVNQRFKVHLNKIVTFMRSKPGPLETSWVDLGFAELVSLLNTMDFRFKDHNLHIQNYAGRIFALPQFIVYRKSTRFHERPYNGMGALYK